MYWTSFFHHFLLASEISMLGRLLAVDRSAIGMRPGLRELTADATTRTEAQNRVRPEVLKRKRLDPASSTPAGTQILK
jgi:hypothetical protein